MRTTPSFHAASFATSERDCTVCVRFWHTGAVRLDIESLRMFQAVVSTGSFTEAAAQLSLTQSAVSWKMKRLEERLGAPLISREGRQIHLTEFGDELLEHAERIVSAHDEAVDSLYKSQLEGTVKLGTNDEIEAVAMAQVAASFRRRHPMVRLHHRVGLSAPISQQLKSGELDVALIRIFEPEPGDVVLWSDRLQWVCSPSYIDHVGDHVPLITFGSNCIIRPVMVDALNDAGIDHFSAFEAENSVAIWSAVEANLGVAVMNERNGLQDHRVWTREGFDSSLPDVHLVIRTNKRSRSEAVAALVDEFVRALGTPS